MTRKSEDIVLSAEGLGVSFDDRVVLQDINVNVQRGEIFVFMGGGACGKSVLFQVLTGDVAPTKGRVKLLGHELRDLKSRTRSQLLRKVGIAYQGGALLKSLTVLENVELPLIEVAGLKRRDSTGRAKEFLALLGLSKVEALSPSSLSMSEIKRVALARALVLEPEVLFCDDVFSGLGWRLQDKLFKLLLDLGEGKGLTVIVFTPALDVAFRFGDQVAILEEGCVIAQGPVDEIKTNKDERVQHLLAPKREILSSRRRVEPNAMSERSL